MPCQLMVCRPEGGQKLRSNNVVAHDLKKCKIESEWRQIAMDRRVWRGTTAALVEDLNEESELQEKQKKDFRKRKGEEEVTSDTMWSCGVNGCAFGAQSRAGLVNHQRQKHGPQATSLFIGQLCGEYFKRQGLRNHERTCGRCRFECM